MLSQMTKDRKIITNQKKKSWWSYIETFKTRVIFTKKEKKCKPSKLVKSYDFEFREQVNNEFTIKR